MIVLDTHVWIWLVAEDKKRLRSPMRRAIAREMEGDTVMVSTISVWEIAVKVAVGKLNLGFDMSAWFQHARSQFPEIHIEPLSPEDAIDSTRLPGTLHKDPADRIIVALARRNNARLATLDATLMAYPHVQVVR